MISVFSRFLFILLCLPVSQLMAQVETPKVKVERTVAVVRDLTRSHLDNLDSPELDQKLRREAMPLFNFVEMSQRSLGANWKKGTKDQQKEFVELFSDLLARTYAKRIKDSVADSKISVVDESIEGKKAIVRTVATVDGDDVNIDYRFSLRSGSWSVYDVIIENIGLVSNYRNEFSGVVRKEGFDGLLKRLQEKRDHEPE